MLRRNVLIFHQAALGDFIVTWPLAMALSRILAQSRIIYVTHSQKGALAERVLRIESVDAEAGWHALHVALPDVPKLPDRSAKLLEGSQIVISFTAGQQDAFADGIRRVAPQAKIVSLDTKRASAGHVAESLLEQLAPEPALAAAMQQMLRSVESRGTGFTLTPADRIVIHPGAGKEANRWSAEGFLQVASRFKAEGKQVRILIGEAEIDRWPAELLKQFRDAFEVRQPQTLLDLLNEIASANVFIGNDSGPSHLAGIIGVPTLTLFGPSDPVRWRPLGPRVRIIHSPNIAEITPESVYTSARDLVGG